MKKLAVMAVIIITMLCSVINVCATDLQEISAKGAVVINGQTGEILFEQNAYEKLPMASTTKIMSALLALEYGNLDEKFTVDSNAIKVEGSSMGLQEGDVVTLRDLCCGMLLPSGNDAANATAVRVAGSVEKFVELMNKRAKELGMYSTHFVTPSGLDDDTDEHYSTAYDMAILTAKAMENQTFREICGSEQIELCFGNPSFDRWLVNTNKLLKNCDGVVGVKTGFTDKAKRCLVSACERKGVTLVCVTLNDPNDWADHTALFDYCFEFLSEQKLPLYEDKFNVNLVGSNSETVKCHTDTAKAVLLNGRASGVTAKVFLPRFVYAPVSAGDKVGWVEYYYKGIKLAEKDIVCDETKICEKTEKLGFFEYYYQKIKNVFG